ncbi:hypothetical protein [[Erwinia] mediterraneensis]|uniref:hypothetical protein n=1 Tax=[Erwinia] mediterraneensis TaxID=2161819 RepID=UPI001031EB5F|nr:hypothetical protein [[Erwinia] mediterraneensis]
MCKFPKGSIVKMKTGEIKGEVINIFKQGDAPAGYYVKWDDGNHSYHLENELCWANIHRPRMHYNPPPAK